MAGIDLLEYLRGDGRLYEMVNNWSSQAEVVQTHRETDGELQVFYHVKNSQWEELWADEVFIYRGTDTSPGNGEAYTLTEKEVYGSVWCPRVMRIGDAFRRSPTVTFRRKSDGQPIADKAPFQQITWLRLVAVHDKLKFAGGIQLPAVAELHGFLDNGGKPAATAFEKYYYAKTYGLVAWEDPNSTWKSWIAQVFTPEIMPQRVREPLPWLASIRQRRLSVPKLPAVTERGAFVVERIPSDFVNIRAYPTTWGRDLGDLHKGDAVTLYAPEVNGWVKVKTADAQGWVSLQNGAVAFATTPEPDPIPIPGSDDEEPTEPLPPDDLPPTSFVWPGTLEDAIRMRHAYRLVEEGARKVREELDRLIDMME
ncbi:MAG: SH3 domain-containing protein [Chloroflexi bacterium]|nr:SH3 domain-containing protein [Chloroflexota bacterium]